MARSKFKVGQKVLIRGEVVCSDVTGIYPVIVKIINSKGELSFTEEGKHYYEDGKPCLEIDKEAGHDG